MYILQEIQTTGNTTSLLPAQTFTEKNQAESAFYSVLAAAAISNVTVHTAVLYDEFGALIRREAYDRRANK